MPRKTTKDSKPARATRPVATFVASFLAIVTLLAMVRAAGFGAPAELMGRSIAQVVYSILTIAHANVSVAGNVISVPGGSLQVTEACSGFDLMALLVAAILPYPVAWQYRLVGVALVVPFVSMLNVVRVTTLTLVLRHAPGAFEICHALIWQGVLVLSVLAYWVVWVNTALAGRLHADPA